ncbi:hypothetical protein CSKR_106568 [Clonorchis sinensis]|uniref:Uncharacterized protein n=2 Tax=Clonorchis sinensis TaxID=79923 RepID=G7YSN1_CLOSI|nr:hypothetical protein CSKR_106568 [Clonorchis sinensis]GAA55961.1 hypothetical protein CLF_109460 [Clonorchis sinensis]
MSSILLLGRRRCKQATSHESERFQQRRLADYCSTSDSESIKSNVELITSHNLRNSNRVLTKNYDARTQHYLHGSELCQSFEVSSCTFKQGLIGWNCLVDGVPVKIALCPKSFRVWCNGSLVCSTKARITYQTMHDTGQHKSTDGQVNLEFHPPSSKCDIQLCAAYHSPVDICGVIHAESQLFPTQLSHMVTSLGVKLSDWHIHCVEHRGKEC